LIWAWTVALTLLGADRLGSATQRAQIVDRDAPRPVVILAPIMWLFGFVYARVPLESVVVFLRIERNTKPRP
jgi:hypothetical protein